MYCIHFSFLNVTDAIHRSLYYIHFEITCGPCSVIGSQQWDLF